MTTKDAPRVGSDTFCITIVGSGVSNGVPVIGHLSNECACALAIKDPNGRNRRNNASLLITVPSQDANDGDVKHVLIDCGKTFRDAYFRVLARHNVREVDALLITHDHADAMAGLDDLRDLQRMCVDDSGNWFVEHYIPTYLSKKTLDSLQEQFGYIYRNSRIVGAAPQSREEYYKLCFKEQKNCSNNNIGVRRAAALELFTLSDTAPTPFYVHALGDGFAVHALPVEHGAGYMALGFAFGRGVAFRSRGATFADVSSHSCVVYISDVSFVPEFTMNFLQDLVKIDVLIVDLLYGSGKKSSIHFCMDDVLRLVECLQPTRTYTVGMFCSVEYDSGNKILRDKLQELRSKNKCTSAVCSVELGFDGLDITLPL